MCFNTPPANIRQRLAVAFGGIGFGLRDITDCDEEILSCCIDDFAIFTFGDDGGFKSPRHGCFLVSVANRSVGAFDELVSR